MSMFKRSFLVLGALAVTAACQDLEVVNENNPGFEQALSTPESVENVITSSFTIWWDRQHGGGAAAADLWSYYPDASGAFARTASRRGVMAGEEPRPQVENDPESAHHWIQRSSWDGFASGTANANDGLRMIIQEGMEIIIAEDPEADDPEFIDQTDRAYTWARLWQGINQGYMALVHDQSAPADETTQIGGPIEWEGPNLTPYDEVMEIAIGHIERAIERAETGDQWVTGDRYINGQAYNNAEVIQFAHTMAARMLVFNARTPQERAAVDWARVQYHAERGLDFDFGPMLESGEITANGFTQRVYLNINNPVVYRIGQRVVGMADVSGNFQDWLASDLDQRRGFLVESPDLRFQGPWDEEAEAYANGSYVRGNLNSNVNPDIGPYLESFYGYHRRQMLDGNAWNTGFHAIATADENRLLLAEAYLRQDQHQMAADLINESRTRPVTLPTGEVLDNTLPPVTASGVPQSQDCVPRARFGAAPLGDCGTLEDALLYERIIELMDIDPLRGWADFRGFGFLPEGQAYHMPVPGRYIVGMALPIYTFGGAGNDGAAAGYP